MLATTKKLLQNVQNLPKDEQIELLEILTKSHDEQTKKKGQSFSESILNDSDLDQQEFQVAWSKMKTDMQECREGFNF